tara:strand:- start:1211 stop:2377 length:1167 start_codon:yes stop_codon:yes gene_type:complete
MKSNDKTQKNSQIKNTISPQSAMDDYFNGMFGSSVEDPLEGLSTQQDSKCDEAAKHDSAKNNETKSPPKPKLKPKKQKTYFNSLSFDEPELKATNISPLIIPAAFPKLAPAQAEAKPKEKVLPAIEPVVTSSSQVIEPKTGVKIKLDAKTALALLEKQKSKLTISQKQRLEEKLKQLSKAKVQTVIQLGDSESAVSLSKSPAEDFKGAVEASTDMVTEREVVISSDQVVQKNDKPDWANGRFECLIFSVAGLKLAVPLISLGAIYKIEKEFTPLVGRVSWFMGLYHHLDRNIRVVDTAQLVMPERCTPEVRASYKFIIRLGGNDWGIACDAVHQSIQLSPDQVKWRSERSKRAWLFGTVIDHMCALIDTDSLSTMLNQHGTKNPSVFF